MDSISQSLEDYLEAVYMLIADGKPAQVRDVAKTLSVKMPSVVKAIHELKRLGLCRRANSITDRDILTAGEADYISDLRLRDGYALQAVKLIN